MTAWLKDNGITLILLAISGALAWGGLSSRVEAVDNRTQILEKKMSEYPSKEYFEEKFKNTNDNISRIDSAFQRHIELNKN